MREIESEESRPLIGNELRTHVLFYWHDAGQRWLDQLPDAITAICERWQLTLGASLDGASTAYVVAAVRDDGVAGVLKIVHPEVSGEAEALLAYGTERAIEVFAHEGAAMFLERATPGLPLRETASHDEIVDVTCALMVDLWQCAPPPNITPLAIQCERFSQLGKTVLCDRPDLPKQDFEEGLTYLVELPRSTRSNVLLHGDLHPGNILSAIRRPWLVTDPRPLVGEAEYELMQLIIEPPPATGDTIGITELLARIETVATRLGLSALRIAQWGVARRTDWSLFCYGSGDDRRGAAARREMQLFSEATRLFQ